MAEYNDDFPRTEGAPSVLSFRDDQNSFRILPDGQPRLVFSLERPFPVHGVLDLRGRNWSAGPVNLGGEWAFGSGWRTIPDQWTGTEAGSIQGRGSGIYRLTILLDENHPELALRYATASTAMAIRADGVELARVGTPASDPERTDPAYAPGR